MTVFSSAPLIPVVHAASADYAALRVTTTGSGDITMEPGEVKSIAITFQNTGSATWKNDGVGYISLYTYGPKYRKSVFDPGNWLSAQQVKRIRESSVAPGQTASVLFDLHAPATEGAYTETFALAAEEMAWVTGGELSLTITVSKKSATSSSSTLSSTTLSSLSATVVTQTADKVKAKAGKNIPFMVAIKNTGSTAWTSVALEDVSVQMASTSKKISFANATWKGSEASSVSGQKIASGEITTLQFFLTAPAINGTHTAVFQLIANGEEVDDVFVEIPVTVTGGSGEALDDELVVEQDDEEDVATYIDEPTMRVGVLIVDEETDWEVSIGSDQSVVELRDTNGTLLSTIAKGDDLRAAYTSGRYEYGSGSSKKYSTLPLRFVPTTANAVLEVTNFDRRLTRGTSYANNTFRNVLELRYNTKKERTWLINELPMEYYLRGLAETSNVSPTEFQKALLTAARTYAYYHYTHASKHAAEGFLVDAYRDQVYWGYGQEERTPNITAGVEATRGKIVTYEGETAITPYFSRSDGHTRDWSDVWAGDVPWAKSVEVPCDKGKTLWGHGVGMSASGALCMANDGKSYDDILKYFYTGIAIDKKWE